MQDMDMDGRQGREYMGVWHQDQATRLLNVLKKVLSLKEKYLVLHQIILSRIYLQYCMFWMDLFTP